ncbi:MAG: potassium/proton antiporter [Ginsengibacter sp.]
MTFTAENILFIGSILLLASVFTSKTSARFGIPTLVLFIGVGMLAGSEGIGGIYFYDPKLAQILGVIALNFILFSGGLDTKFESIRPVLWRGISLSSLGVIFTALTVGIFVHLVTNFSLMEGLLLGSIVSSTDAAAVFSILRSKNIGLKGYIRPTLELESGSNDPFAFGLTITLTSLIATGESPGFGLVFHFLKEIIFGAAVGLLLGRFVLFVLNKVSLDIEGLYPVFLMAFVFFTFSFTGLIGGNGFLAVYIAGLVLGNNNFIHKKSIIRFYDGQAWLMQIIMFLTLGLLVFPSHILPVMGLGVLISLILIFVARPIGVFISLSFFKRIHLREKLFISWVGLRGAVPIVFATYPLIANLDKSPTIFNLVFFISTISVLLQGTTLPLVAKWLRVIVPQNVKRKFALDLELSESPDSEMIEILLPDTSPAIGSSLVNLNFPKKAFIVMIQRAGKYIRPGGSTVIEKGDKLVVLASGAEVVEDVFDNLGYVEEQH